MPGRERGRALGLPGWLPTSVGVTDAHPAMVVDAVEKLTVPPPSDRLTVAVMVTVWP